jgi:hypothetical protein
MQLVVPTIGAFAVDFVDGLATFCLQVLFDIRRQNLMDGALPLLTSAVNINSSLASDILFFFLERALIA